MTPTFPPAIMDLLPWDNMQDFIDDFTKGLQELIDAVSQDPDADNNRNLYIPHTYGTYTCLVRMSVNNVSTNYNDWVHSFGQQPYAGVCKVVINGTTPELIDMSVVGRLYAGDWYSIRTPEEIETLNTDMASWFKPENFVFENLEQPKLIEMSADQVNPNNTRFLLHPAGYGGDKLKLYNTDINGERTITPVRLWFYPIELRDDGESDYGRYSVVGGSAGTIDHITSGNFTVPYGTPIVSIFTSDTDAQDFVNKNGADNNYTLTYQGDGDEIKVYYGDNYIIYVVPDDDEISYDDIYNVTVDAVNDIDPTIHVPTYRENKYGPEPPDPDDDDIDEQDMGVGTNLGGLGGYWLLTKAQLADLHGALNNAPIGFDPLNSFISLIGLGVDVTKVLDATQIQYITPINIRMSDGTTWSTGVEGHIISSNEIVSAFNSDTFKIKRKYNNFLDYSPYATHELFIPMCGWITLPDIAVDRDIYVTYLPDIESGKCRAVVSVVSNLEGDNDSCVIAEKDGIMASDVPFSNVGHSLFVGDAIINGANVAGEIITGAIGAGFTKSNAKGGTYRPYEGFTVGMGGTLPGAIGNALVSGNINRTHFMTGNSTKTGFSDGESIIVKSVYHIPDMPDNYAHTVGLVCNKTGQLSEFNGFTVCDNPHITFSALEAEKDEIKRLLEEGVILPSGE